jgi:hypothetical protein
VACHAHVVSLSYRFAPNKALKFVPAFGLHGTALSARPLSWCVRHFAPWHLCFRLRPAFVGAVLPPIPFSAIKTALDAASVVVKIVRSNRRPLAIAVFAFAFAFFVGHA